MAIAICMDAGSKIKIYRQHHLSNTFYMFT